MTNLTVGIFYRSFCGGRRSKDVTRVTSLVGCEKVPPMVEGASADIWMRTVQHRATSWKTDGTASTVPSISIKHSSYCIQSSRSHQENPNILLCKSQEDSIGHFSARGIVATLTPADCSGAARHPTGPGHPMNQPTPGFWRREAYLPKKALVISS